MVLLRRFLFDARFTAPTCLQAAYHPLPGDCAPPARHHTPSTRPFPAVMTYWPDPPRTDWRRIGADHDPRQPRLPERLCIKLLSSKPSGHNKFICACARLTCLRDELISRMHAT